jgi:hypothetical protein
MRPAPVSSGIIPIQPLPKVIAILSGVSIFFSAFLLFAIQPLIARFILPWFGGSSAVWTTCLLFFQLALLAGYAYAHLSTRYLRPRSQAMTHGLLLIAAIATLPIVPGAQWKPVSPDAPVLRILELLTVCIGVPYFVLSATGPLLQAWLARIVPGAVPYRFYALSNAASLLALLSYPFVIEPLLTRRVQARAWESCFGMFAICCAACAWKMARAKAAIGRSEVRAEQRVKPSLGIRWLWFLLPMCGSILLLATTNKLCLDVASFPFLWVLPLGIYLLTFILCFDRPAWYRRNLFTAFLPLSLIFILYALFQGNKLSLTAEAVMYGGGLFVACMLCHGEVCRLKPSAGWLTSFYLCIAAGGAAGGVLVAVVAPLVFHSYAEFNWGWWLLAALVFVARVRERPTGSGNRRRLPVMPVAAGLLLLLPGAFWWQSHLAARDPIAVSRDFYGVLRVLELRPHDPGLHSRLLVNGSIDHGLQFLSPDRRALPATYYHPATGIGLALQQLPVQTNRNIGLVGLGAGTLAAYGRPGDRLRFYELNPQVIATANRWFTYLNDCKADVQMVPGDARSSLEREPSQQFDLLVLDAFSSDSIPVHLLTIEAFDIYARHLKAGGVIAVHVSNRNLDLIPVVMGAMEHLEMDMVYIHWTREPMPFGLHHSSWLLLTHNRDFLNLPPILSRAERPDRESDRTVVWTDDYASVFPLLRK